MDHQSGQIGALLVLLALAFNNQVVTGGLVSDGGTTQGSGSGTALNFDADVSAIVTRIDGIATQKGAATDIAASAGISFGATSGKEVIYTVVIHTGADNATAPAFAVYPSAVADTGAGEARDDAYITTQLGHGYWLRLSDVTVVRTGDTTVTFTANDAVRAAWAKANAPKTSEADFRLPA
jgi:hypothetical protein